MKSADLLLVDQKKLSIDKMKSMLMFKKKQKNEPDFFLKKIAISITLGPISIQAFPHSISFVDVESLS